MLTKSLIAPLSGATLAAMLLAAPAESDVRRPQLVEGTSAVYQRVLTLPGGNLFDQPGGREGVELWPLQPVYVYSDRDGWLEVGRSVLKGPEGWIEETASVPWHHNIVGAFTNRGDDRPRQLMFESNEGLSEVLNHQAMLDVAKRYREAAVGGAPEEGSDVLTIEPETFKDITNDFYLMPVLQFREIRHPMNRRRSLVMELASVTEENTPGATGPVDLRTGVVFVIDTTMSMQPFIHDTLQAVRKIVDSIAAGEAGDSVSFGLIGFRDNPDNRPGTEYRTKIYAPLVYGAAPDAFLDSLSNMKAMTTSTWGFEEDSISGLRRAINDMEWQVVGEHDFAGRLIILITDAGPKASDDPNAGSDMNSEALRQLASENDVGIATIHIKSSAGRFNHELAEAEYRRLSRFMHTPEEMYFPVDASGAPFQQGIQRVVTAIVNGVADEQRIDYQQAGEESEDSLGGVGPAMRLAYLGRRGGEAPPSFLRGWTTDRGLEQPNLFAVEPRVLVTRNQMATMVEVMRQIVDISRETELQGEESSFFDSLRGIVTQMSGDPARAVAEDFDTLAIAIGEFLTLLPYIDQSPVMGLTEREWLNSPAKRREIVLNLEAKLELYQDYYNTEQFWTALYDGAPEGEQVFAMPFSALP